MNHSKNIFILGVSSDIGRGLAKLFVADGCRVIGTCRQTISEAMEKDLSDVTLIPCDVSQPESVHSAVEAFSRLALPWDIFISCVGSMEPIGSFFSVHFDDWEKSVIVNSTGQLRVLHAMYPYRRPGSISHVVFFAGGGTNGVFPNYSSYCLSKILLIKACELLDDEAKDLNVFILGPGWVRTKIHKQTLENPDGAGANYSRTTEFLNSGNPGASYEEIHRLIIWCMSQGREIAGGRNFSLVHDLWRNDSADLADALARDRDMFKLRRYTGRPRSTDQ